MTVGLSARLQRAWWQAQPSVWSVALWPAAVLYRLLANLNRWSWRKPWRQPAPLLCPVLVVGNLVVGGAGKTPTTIAVVEGLRQRGWHPGVVSRGYGRQSRDWHLIQDHSTPIEAGDEPLLIHRRTHVPVAVFADRAEAGRQLLQAQVGIDVIVADDGLQHHRLHRDVELIVLDARGIGNGQLLPAGPLREPLPRHLSPKQFVVYNADQASTRLPGVLAQRQITGLCRLEDWWRGGSPDPQALVDLCRASQQQPVTAVAGLAEPARFFRMLQALGMKIDCLPLPDHHDFGAALPWSSGTKAVIVTEKDAVKLPLRLNLDVPVWVAPLDFHLPDALLDQLDQQLRAAATQKRAHHDA